MLLIIEPNLRGFSGHYAEFVRAAGSRSAENPVEVYAHPAADGLLAAMPGVRVCLEAPRADRTFAEWRTILRAVKRKVPFLVLTADGRHMAAVSIAGALCGRAPVNACLYFHRSPSTWRDRVLFPFGGPARRHALAITPTEVVARSMSQEGWRRVVAAPYPALGPRVPARPVPFTHLLVAGAARLNKGLDLVVGLARQWAGEGRTIPLKVQVSMKHGSRHGRREGAMVKALLSSGYPELQVNETALERTEYIERFRGSLLLAPYAPEQFASQVSGVVLDALLHGAPVIATRGTCPGSVVERFGAGVTIGERTVQALASAIDSVLAEWPAYSGRACEAAVVLGMEHDPRIFLGAMASETS